MRAGDFDEALAVLTGVFLAGLLEATDLRAGLLGAGDLRAGDFRAGLLGFAVFAGLRVRLRGRPGPLLAGLLGTGLFPLAGLFVVGLLRAGLFRAGLLAAAFLAGLRLALREACSFCGERGVRPGDLPEAGAREPLWLRLRAMLPLGVLAGDLENWPVSVRLLRLLTVSDSTVALFLGGAILTR